MGRPEIGPLRQVNVPVVEASAFRRVGTVAGVDLSSQTRLATVSIPAWILGPNVWP